jgi:hypothetical protein
MRGADVTEIRRTRRWLRVAASWIVAIALAPALAIPFVAGPAAAETEEELLAKKDQWQGRYRELRNNAARMSENAKKLRKAYSQAQHANYPRGGAREEFRMQVEQAERDAEDYESKLVAFRDEARQNDVPPGWLYEVDDEPIDHGLPADQDDGSVDEEANQAEDDAEEEAEDREGRNPLYLDDDEPDDTDDEDGDDA